MSELSLFQGYLQEGSSIAEYSPHKRFQHSNLKADGGVALGVNPSIDGGRVDSDPVGAAGLDHALPGEVKPRP